MSGLIREYEVNGDNYDEEKETYSLWKEKDAGEYLISSPVFDTKRRSCIFTSSPLS